MTQPRTFRSSGRRLATFALLLVFPLLVQAQPASEKAADPNVAATKEALGQLNSLIGGWRGVGQPRRGSTQGAWQETAEWIWDFSDKQVALKLDVTKGNLVKTLRLTTDPATGIWSATVVTPDEQTVNYSGTLDNRGTLVLNTEEQSDPARRITVTRLNDKRMLILFEQKTASQSSFNRVAEIGYTRQGTKLAGSTSSATDCIVTGGTGTIEVKHKGETYYVCCTGCLQVFKDDPDTVIAEAKARRQREASLK